MISVSVSLAKRTPRCSEGTAELEVVFDDSVVDDRDVAREVGMCVRLAGAAVGRPARVPDAHRSFEPALLERRREAFELAHGAHHLDALGLVHGEARRVVAAVLELHQPSTRIGATSRTQRQRCRTCGPDLPSDSPRRPTPSAVRGSGAEILADSVERRERHFRR